MLSRGQRDFPSAFFGLPVLGIFVSNPINLTETFGFRNFQCMRTENHVLRSKIFVSQYARISWVPLLSFRIFGVSTIFVHITVYFRFFLSQSTEKLLEEPSKVSESFKCQVSKNFLQNNGISRFSVEIFLSRSQKNVGEHFGISKMFGYRKTSCLRGRYHFSTLFFRFTVYKIRWGTPLCFRILGTSKTFMLSRGVSRFSVVFLASQC